MLAVLLVGACSDGSGESENAAAMAANEAQADGGGWDVFATQANEVEGFSTLAEMGQIADVAVIAQATGVDGMRRTGGDGDEGIDLVQVRFEVIRSISDWHAESVVVELDAGSPAAARALEERVGGFPPTLLALREKGREEAGFYRLVNSKSLWTEQPGGGVVAPLVEFFEVPEAAQEEREFAAERAEINGLEDLADHLEAARQECGPECGRPWKHRNDG